MKTIKILIILSILLIPASGAKPKPRTVGLRAQVERLQTITRHQGKMIVLLNREIEDLNDRIDDLEGLCLKCCGQF